MQCIDGNMLGKGLQIVMLAIIDDFHKTLSLQWYLGTSDLPDQITLEGYLCHINKLYLHDGETVIGRFLLNPFQNMNTSLLFIKLLLFIFLIYSYLCITVTAIICVCRVYYFFQSHSRDARELVVRNGLLKFSNIQQVENYIQVAQLEFWGRERQ